MMMFKTPSTCLKLLAAGLSLGLLAGCHSDRHLAYDGAAKVARNEVHMVRLAYPIKGAEDGLDGVARDDIVAFLAEIRAGYGDTVSLVENSTFPAESADDVGRILRAHGLSIASGAERAQIGEEPEAGGALLVVDRYLVRTPQCPDRTLHLSRNYTNAPSPHFGCSNVINLGEMVANPRDLLTGNGGASPSTSKAVQAIDAWSREVPVILVPTGATGGGSSGSGGA